MNALFNTFAKLAEAQQLQSRAEFVRYESRVIQRQVSADAVIADGAMARMRAAIEQLEREVRAFDHYVNHVAGRAPQ